MCKLSPVRESPVRELNSPSLKHPLDVVTQCPRGDYKKGDKGTLAVRNLTITTSAKFNIKNDILLLSYIV